ncbi:response regulator [Pseudomonas aeruginosa]|uniref:response regulator n=1 Tax=Pseudomonas aeruginosa TaxID=287 RepID=UPI003CFF4078
MSPSPVRILFVDDEERILRSLAMQFRRHYEVLTESDPRRALERLKTERIQVLVSDLKLAGEHTAPLLKSLAQAHPRLLSLVVTPFRDTQALLELINQAQIFRYLPKPIRRGLFEKGLKAAAEQALLWRGRSLPEVDRLAEVPRDEREKERVGSLLGMLGRLRERLTA